LLILSSPSQFIHKQFNQSSAQLHLPHTSSSFGSSSFKSKRANSTSTQKEQLQWHTKFPFSKQPRSARLFSPLKRSLQYQTIELPCLSTTPLSITILLSTFSPATSSFGVEQEKLWDIGMEEARKTLPTPVFAQYESKIQGLLAAYDTLS
jgi:hypothetical protein